jgi:hypothetical protein
MAHDWALWHRHYEKSRPLQRRLRAVCAQIRQAIGECAPGPIRVASVCSGDGRDIINALSKHSRQADARVWLLDTNVEAVRRGRALAAAAGMTQELEFVPADASQAASYAGIVPVDVLVSGVLGHLRHADVGQFIQYLPTLCRRGASVIWNRHLVLHEGGTQVPSIRRQLHQAGFEEAHFETASRNGFVVGRARFIGRPQPFNARPRLFEFVGTDILDPKAQQRRPAIVGRCEALLRRILPL